MKKIETLVKQLAEVAQQKKEIELQEEAIKGLLLEELRGADPEEGKTPYGKVTIARRSYYTYSDNIKKLAEEIKLKQVEEQEKGIAVEKVTEYVLFKAKAE